MMSLTMVDCVPQVDSSVLKKEAYGAKIGDGLA